MRAQCRTVDGRMRTWCADPRDRDALHDVRTALRRLRVLVRDFQTDLGSLAGKRIRRDLRAAFRATSGIRDRDVFVAWLLTLRPSVASRHLLREAESQARTRASAAVERVARLWRRIHRKLTASRRRITPPARRRSFGVAVSQAIREEVETVDAGLAAWNSQVASAIHAARIAAKRLRYLLEALAGRSPDARRAIEWCRAFQDLVGEWRDATLATRRARACPALAGRDRVITQLTNRRRQTRVELRRFALDREAWAVARRDALLIGHRYRVLSATSRARDHRDG